MINILIIFYISLINNYLLINYNNKEYKLQLKSENKLLLKSNITNNIEKNNDILNIENKFVKQKNKFCNFQCNCFFSHTVKSDNINIQKSDWMIHYGLS
tara:strand:+ start:1178 stop:1474 length:297 start_codon:yes stop_codon:yes gene_type:complete